MSRRQQRFLGAAIILASLALSAKAQVQQDDASGDDPTRGTARISVIQGEVNVKRGDSGEVVAAALNAPLMTQDHLQTADGSRSEIQFDSSNLVRLAPNTDLGLAAVARGRYQLQLAAGTIIFRIFRDLHADVELDAPSIALRPRTVGAYRVTVMPDGSTSVTVRAGQAEVYSPRGSQTLASGQTMLVRGPSSDPEFQMEREIALDQFDDWSNNRDQAMQQSQSSQYVPPEVAGGGDLDANGSWVPSSYGPVWAPQVAPGWAPYQNGRWAWEDYYGWTWVDYDPWGWAPFHYGRWFWNGGRGWCWWPGAIGRPFFWRPALVGFFGFGAGGVGVGFGFGFGNVGWVALAPFEPWHPWYGRGWYGGPGWGGGYNRTIVNNTFIHNTNIYNSFRNARVNNGVAYTAANNFGRGSGAFYRANGAQIRDASLVRGQLPITPGRGSLAFSNHAATGYSPRFAAPSNQRFFSRQQPQSNQRTSFTQQQQQMARFQEQTLGTRPNIGAEQNRFGNGNPNSRQSFAAGGNSGYNQAPSAPGNQGYNQRGGWQRLGQATPQTPSTQMGRAYQGQGNNNSMNRPQGSPMNAGPNGADNAWHRFGDPGASSNVRPAPQQNGSGGWHTFGSPGGMSPSENRGSFRNNFGSNQRYSQPQMNRSAEPMRMNPPIVHDRSTYSAPRQSAPHYSAPASRSFGGGGGHPSGGGGGGHSGGGGGGHSGGGGGHRR